MPALLLALLPALYWDRPIDTADNLHQAGIERLYVPPERVKEWREHGFDASPFDRAGAQKAVAPKVEYRISVASATRVPWVDANGWRFERQPGRTYLYERPAGGAALAAAEAFAYGIAAGIAAAPEDLEPFAAMQRFLQRVDRPAEPVKANIGIVDDGSDELGEVLNLMARHNLLFQVIRAPDPRYDLNVRLGSAEYPKTAAGNPYAFTVELRRQLTDQRRLLRIYGSDVVLGRLTGSGGHVRLHLLNYGGRVVKGLRVRLRGVYADAKLIAFGQADTQPADFAAADGATEFSIPALGHYAVVDLSEVGPGERRP
jgi:hypothetical protein